MVLGVPFFALGVVLVTRWFSYYLLSDTYSSRLPGLFFGLGAILLAVQVWMVAFVADLMAANRKLASEQLLLMRKAELDEPADS